MSDNEPKLPKFDIEQMRKDAIRIHADAIYQMGGDPVQLSYVDALTQRLAAANQRAAEAEARAAGLATVAQAARDWIMRQARYNSERDSDPDLDLVDRLDAALAAHTPTAPKEAT